MSSREGIIIDHILSVNYSLRLISQASTQRPKLKPRKNINLQPIKLSFTTTTTNSSLIMPLPLAGKHCAIVGATGIIGSHIAKAFASHGAVLSLLGRSALDVRPRLEPELVPYSGGPEAHRFIRLDVQQRGSIKDVFASRAGADGVSGLKF